MLRHMLRTGRAALAAGAVLAFAGLASAQPIPGNRITSVPKPEQPMVRTPSNLPTYLTSINYPLIYGAYATWPYAAPISFTNGASLPSSLPDTSMKPTPVITKAYASELAAPATSATVNVLVPSDADLWFEGMLIPEAGRVRRFTTPALDPLQSYSYTVKANWVENGQQITQTQRILVKAGDDLRVRFPSPTGTTATSEPTAANTVIAEPVVPPAPAPEAAPASPNRPRLAPAPERTYFPGDSLQR